MADDVFAMIEVEQLVDGDAIDLEGDDYADPWPHEDAFLACELVVVEGTSSEPHLTVVYTNGGNWAFPKGWQVKRRQEC